MFVIRPVELSDLPQVAHLAKSSGPGLSLPKDPDHLRILIQESLISFSKEVLYPGSESYLFVCEKVASGKIVGCCAIRAKTGGYIPLYMYQVVDVIRTSPITQERAVITRLHPHPIHDGPTELCTLYLLPKYRKSGLGPLLSLSRFLFLRKFQDRFEKKIMALMRPHIAPSGVAPFWDAIAKPFFQMDFPTVCTLRYTKPRIIEVLLPKYPIYASLLPHSVQDSIGKAHPNTLPAVEMLKREGFEETDLIDAIDGGPMVEASLDKIDAIQRQKEGVLERITDHPPNSKPYVIANPQIAFRACLGEVRRSKEGGVTLSKEVAETLEVKLGDSLAYLSTRSQSHDR